MMIALSVQNLWKSFDGKPALQGVSFEIAQGEIVALLGPSGCGKSTVLNLIAGLAQPDIPPTGGGASSLSWQAQSLAGIPPHKRGFGLMFQDYALFPHLNVQENIAFGLRMAGSTQAQIRSRVEEMLKLVGMEGFGGRDVNTLSGGEAQRVALARSLAPQPRFLMLDEPLGALDRALRQRLVVDLRHILRQIRQTALYVTHDQEEAFTLADRVVLLDQGQVAQIGKPQQLYRQPATPFVARFLGLDNLLEGTVIAAPGGWAAETEVGVIPLQGRAQTEVIPSQGRAQRGETPIGAREGSAAPLRETGDGMGMGQRVTLLLRPDVFRVDGAGPAYLEGTLIERTFQGSVSRVQVQSGAARLSFDLPGAAELPRDGERIRLSYDPERAVHLF